MYISAIKKPDPIDKVSVIKKPTPSATKKRPPRVTPLVTNEIESFERPTLGRKPIIIGAFMLVAFLLGLAGWAAFASISSAAIAPGVVAVEGERKTVQHFEGGVIKQINVSVAQQVSVGEVLVVLDATKAESDLLILEDHYILAQARAARLRAERDGLESIVFPENLKLLGNRPSVIAAIEDQQRQFLSRRERYKELLVGYRQQLDQLEKKVSARQAERGDRNKTLELLQEEIETLSTLKEKGLIPANRLYQLRRSESSVIAERSAGLAAIAGANEEIANTKLQILELEDRRSNAADLELQTLQGDLLATRQRLRTAKQSLERTRITAPASGTIMNMKFHTPGGVIQPGETIMDIIPGDPKLVINARVDPKDRDVVAAGLSAEVRFSAFNRRHTQPVPAKVVFVSADRIEATSEHPPHFIARVELDLNVSDDSAAIGARHTMPDIHPGMQAEVIIITGERTLLDYLLQPIRSSLSRALKED